MKNIKITDHNISAIEIKNLPKEFVHFYNGISYLSDNLDEAPLKIGTRIYKTIKGDTIPKGSKGVIIGSLSTLKPKYSYTVLWDDLSTVPMMVFHNNLAEDKQENSALQKGLKEIDEAKWKKDKYGYFNLQVTHPNGSNIQCYLSLRPTYCDRGHMQLNIDGQLDLDGADSFPRFFFNFEEADKHTRVFLKWRLWKHRTYEHKIK